MPPRIASQCVPFGRTATQFLLLCLFPARRTEELGRCSPFRAATIALSLCKQGHLKVSDLSTQTIVQVEQGDEELFLAARACPGLRSPGLDSPRGWESRELRAGEAQSRKLSWTGRSYFSYLPTKTTRRENTPIRCLFLVTLYFREVL